ncbi:hypothetical protein B5M43_011985 [Microbacterium sp. MEC084]|uniref:hypothetical protein n=1 Tax=unclassified Microbacterium TaxID=2609290 RepID=UPI0006F7F6C9|nr:MULTISPECIES: hypothetical protein [unclassified Microbacterium]KQZ07220.1 hypothetical protein ASD19_12250 [Microbacterium sp. Root53]MCD1269544.1 hypothetical protein [Microbacterium sp. MEC084]
MNVKALVVVLVALVVAAGLVLFYGALKPPASPDDARGGVEGSLGWLDLSRPLSFEDVADAPCARADLEALVVPAASACSAAVPDPARILLCTETPGDVIVRTRGADYPEQEVDAADLSCARPVAVPVYDDESTLMLVCTAVAGECVVRVLPPEDAG